MVFRCEVVISFVLQVRTITALSLAALAEASHPYGIESFDPALEDLWRGVRRHAGKALAAFLKVRFGWRFCVSDYS